MSSRAHGGLDVLAAVVPRQTLDLNVYAAFLLENDHAWGHATEFFAIGTAVRPLRDDHVVTPPSMVVPLSG